MRTLCFRSLSTAHAVFVSPPRTHRSEIVFPGGMGGERGLEVVEAVYGNVVDGNHDVAGQKSRDVRGRAVRTVVAGVRMGPGAHEAALDARGLAAGVYFARLECGGEVAGEKVIVAR